MGGKSGGKSGDKVGAKVGAKRVHLGAKTAKRNTMLLAKK